MIKNRISTVTSIVNNKTWLLEMRNFKNISARFLLSPPWDDTAHFGANCSILRMSSLFLCLPQFRPPSRQCLFRSQKTIGCQSWYMVAAVSPSCVHSISNFSGTSLWPRFSVSHTANSQFPCYYGDDCHCTRHSHILITLISARFQVFTTLTIKNAVFWDDTPCGSCKGRRFVGYIVVIIRMRKIGELRITLKNGVFWNVRSCGSCENRRFGAI
jgi:hypothetical protein